MFIILFIASLQTDLDIVLQLHDLPDNMEKRTGSSGLRPESVVLEASSASAVHCDIS